MAKLQGIDACIETSLKEYGLAWAETETDYLFYYGIGFTENKEYNCAEHSMFDHSWIAKNIDILSEYDWVNFDKVFATVGMSKEDWLQLSIPQQISDLISYYGSEEILGSSYWEGKSYRDVMFGVNRIKGVKNYCWTIS